MHYTLIVAVPEWANVEDLMAPFDENLEVPGHWSDYVSESEKEKFCNYYKEDVENFEDAYKRHGNDWNGNRWKKNSLGAWREWSTWNENAQWDWYEVGGRWPGRLTLKEGSESEPGVSFSWGWSEDEKKKFLAENPRCADRAKKKDVANLEELSSWALLIDGEWIDVGDWKDDDKDLKVYDYLKDLDDEIVLVCIDYHM